MHNPYSRSTEDTVELSIPSSAIFLIHFPFSTHEQRIRLLARHCKLLPRLLIHLGLGRGAPGQQSAQSKL